MVSNSPTSGSEKPSTRTSVLDLTDKIESTTQYFDLNFKHIPTSLNEDGDVINQKKEVITNFIKIPKTRLPALVPYLLKPRITALYPRLEELSKLTSLHTYFGTDKLRNRFLHTLFFGLLAKESAFGHIKTVKQEGKNKGVFQLTPIAIKDTPKTLAKNVYKNIWSLKRKPKTSDRTNIKLSTELSLLSFQRIYEICKTQLNDPYFIKNKQSLVIPLLMLGYNLGGSALKKLLRATLANRTNFNSKETKLKQVLKLGLKKRIIKGSHANYIAMILRFRNEFQTQLPTVLKINQEQSQKAARQAGKTARRKLAQSITPDTLPKGLQPRPGSQELPKNLQATPESQEQTKRAAKQAMVNNLPIFKAIDDITTSSKKELPRALSSLAHPPSSSSSEHPEKRPNPRLQAKRPRVKKFADIISAKPTHDQIIEWVIKTYKPKEYTQMLHGKMQLIQEYPYKIKVTSDLQQKEYVSSAQMIASPKQLLENFLETPVSKYASWEKLPNHKRANFLPPNMPY